MTPFLRRLGADCARHPLVTIAAWLSLAVVMIGSAMLLGGRFSQGGSLPGSEIERVRARLSAHFPGAGRESADVVLHGTAARSVLPVVQQRVQALPHVVPASLATARLSADGRTVLLHVAYDVPRWSLDKTDLQSLQEAARAGAGEGVAGYVTGSLPYELRTTRTGTAEMAGMAVAMLVLLAAFGSVVAAGLPVATAAIGLTTGLGIITLLSHVYGVNGSAPAMATMIGVGVGIDYALFVVTRHRDAMARGLTPVAAAAYANATAGASVVYAGFTVVVAICGLAFAGVPIMTSLGVTSALVVALAVVAAITLLPALLGLAGHRINALRVPLPRLRRQGASWESWARRVERRPVRYAVGSALLLLVLAAPALTMRLGQPDGGSAARGSDERAAFLLTAAAFGPGANGPLSVVVELPPGADPAVVGQRVGAAVSRDADVASVAPMQVSSDGTTGIVAVVPRSAPSAEATTRLVDRLRGQTLPALGQQTGATLLLSGQPAGFREYSLRLSDRLPVFVGAVLVLSFLLLGFVFRSLLVPLKAVLLNLLSIAAACGVVTAVFQWGWLSGLLGMPERVPVVQIVPMMMFAIVFGLSMDYEVFLLSRMREEWKHSKDSRESVVAGLTSTARVITAAASIMVVVFTSFTLSPEVVVKMMGLGLAVAVLVDATVIRLVLVPATMVIMGDLNWWFPRWLDRVVPHVDLEQPLAAAAQEGPGTQAPRTLVG